SFFPAETASRPCAPAKPRVFVKPREISVSMRVRGGAGTTQTSNQTVMSGRLLPLIYGPSEVRDRAAQAEPKLTGDGQLAEALSALLPAAWRVIGSPTMATGLSPRNPLLSASESATLTSAG